MRILLDENLPHSDPDESVIVANVEAILRAIQAIHPGALIWVELGNAIA